MDYVTVRELREQSGKVWQRIESGEEIIVTRNGKPFALLLHTEPSEVESALRAHRAARMGAVLERLQGQAEQSGAAKMTQQAVRDEIAAARAERPAAGKRTTARRAASRRR